MQLKHVSNPAAGQEVGRSPLSLFVVSNVIDSLFEHLAVPAKPEAVIDRQLKALRQLQAIRRACLRTKVAKHASRSIEDKCCENLLLVDLLTLPDLAAYRAYLYTVDRTCKRAQIACYAERSAGFWIQIQPRRASEALRNPCGFERVLLGVDRLLGVAAIPSLVKSSDVVLESHGESFEQVKEQ